MGKFDGLLFCSDLDDTLLTDDKHISDENVKALQYFMDNGGKFTFATGRTPMGVNNILKYIVPNAPVVCFNGAAIYDISAEKYIWQAKLDEVAFKAVEFIDKNFPSAGIVVCSDTQSYHPKTNRRVEEYRAWEKFPENYIDYKDIKEEWRKVLFMVEENEIEPLKKLLNESEFADLFDWTRSSPWYYELLPKGSTKGNGMLRLADYLGIDHKNTIAMGDNENDVSSVTMAGMGVAVANAVEVIKKAADMITVDNNSHAAMAVVNYIENHLL